MRTAIESLGVIAVIWAVGVLGGVAYATRNESTAVEVLPDSHGDTIATLAQRGIPDSTQGPIGQPKVAAPSAAWRRAYREVHGREWNPDNPILPKMPTSNVVPWRAPQWLLEQSPTGTPEQNTKPGIIQELRAEIARLRKRLEELEK
jgi:hypothetical protein